MLTKMLSLYFNILHNDIILSMNYGLYKNVYFTFTLIYIYNKQILN